MKSQEMIQVSVRVPAEHVEALTQIAADEDRTLSAELRRIIRRAVKEEHRPGTISQLTGVKIEDLDTFPGTKRPA